MDLPAFADSADLVVAEATPPPSNEADRRRTGRRAVLAATIGAGLELYDFVTFSFFAIQIGHAFFPSTDRYVSLIGALATFGASFVTRPLGAWLLGTYADRVGRKPALLLSMMLMGGAITVLALTPTYATIGYAAPAIAIACRMVQGFAFGGEIGAATTYMMEAGNPRRRAWNVSFQGVSQFAAATVGALVGAGLSAMMTPADLNLFGWRIALLLGASIVPVALVMRRSLPETLESAHAAHAQAQANATAPIALPHVNVRRVLLLCAGLMATGTIGTYFFNYAATFGENELHLSPTVSLAAEAATNFIGIVGCLLGGFLADRYGRKPLLILPMLMAVACFVPAFGWLVATRTGLALTIVNMALSLLWNLPSAANYAVMAEVVPPALRSRAFGLVYAIPVAIFGGSAQLVFTWLLHKTGNPMSVAWYLELITALNLTLAMAMPETLAVAARWRGQPRLAPTIFA